MRITGALDQFAQADAILAAQAKIDADAAGRGQRVAAFLRAHRTEFVVGVTASIVAAIILWVFTMATHAFA